MALKLITAPAYQPVTLAEVKAHLRIDGADDDAYLAALISAAVDAAQNMTRRQLVEAEYELILDAYPVCDTAIELPGPPLLDVSSIKYLDQDGEEQTLPTSDYTVDSESLIGRVYPAYGKSWPSTQDVLGAVRVRFSCGWEMDDSDSPPTEWTGPEAIKAWIKVRVATMYAQREAVVLGQTVAENPRSFIDGLLDPYIVPLVV